MVGKGLEVRLDEGEGTFKGSKSTVVKNWKVEVAVDDKRETLCLTVPTGQRTSEGSLFPVFLLTGLTRCVRPSTQIRVEVGTC